MMVFTKYRAKRTTRFFGVPADHLTGFIPSVLSDSIGKTKKKKNINFDRFLLIKKKMHNAYAREINKSLSPNRFDNDVRNVNRGLRRLRLTFGEIRVSINQETGVNNWVRN